MKISAFTFLRNAHRLGYPFMESIQSVLPLVDEFVISVGPSEDDTLEQIRRLGDPRIRIIETAWNEHIRNDLCVKGFVYGQQKSIALFNCTGDWAIYLEGDEVLHEDDYDRLRESMARHLENPRVEALYFDYLHFYGNMNTLAWSPAWYRREVRVLRNNIPIWAPKGLFFLVPDSYKRWRYPRAAPAQARIFHYGWVRSSEQMKEKVHRTHRHWSDKKLEPDIMAVDAAALRSFRGTHPSVMAERTNPAEGLFQPDPNHRLTRRERRHRWMMKIERMTGLDFSSRHFIPYGQFTIAGSKRPLPLPDPDDLAAPTPSA